MKKVIGIGGNILDQEINQARLITNSIESNTGADCNQAIDGYYSVILTLNNKYDLMLHGVMKIYHPEKIM